MFRACDVAGDRRPSGLLLRRKHLRGPDQEATNEEEQRIDDPPRLAGRYELGDLLGRGGMAEVRRGVDLKLGRSVAIKLLKTELAADPGSLKRFRREAHAVAILNHPGIAAVYDTGERVDPISGVAVPYMVMELVDGATLRES